MLIVKKNKSITKNLFSGGVAVGDDLAIRTVTTTAADSKSIILSFETFGLATPSVGVKALQYIDIVELQNGDELEKRIVARPVPASLQIPITDEEDSLWKKSNELFKDWLIENTKLTESDIIIVEQIEEYEKSRKG